MCNVCGGSGRQLAPQIITHKQKEGEGRREGEREREGEGGRERGRKGGERDGGREREREREEGREREYLVVGEEGGNTQKYYLSDIPYT